MDRELQSFLVINVARKNSYQNTVEINRLVMRLTGIREVTTSNLGEELPFSQIYVSFQQFMDIDRDNMTSKFVILL
jgi:hypothetical protein